MKKIKFLAMIIVPAMAVIMLAGCWWTPTRTSQEVRDRFAAFVNSYEDNGVNPIFRNSIAIDEESAEASYRARIMAIAYSNTNRLQDAVNGITIANVSLGLAAQYRQLHTIYQRMLAVIFHYYSNWEANFFTNINNTAITNNETNELYNRLRNLQHTTDSFLEELQNLETQIATLGIGNNLMGPILNGFNSEFNRLVYASLHFVNYFRYLHVKYIFNSDDITVSTATRLVDEASLLLVQAIFYDNILALERNNATDLSPLTHAGQFNWILAPSDAPNTSNPNSSFARLTGLGQNIFARSNLNVVVGGDQTVRDLLSSEAVGELQIERRAEAVSRVTNLRTLNLSFEQNLGFYRSIMGRVNLQNYNFYRGFANSPSTWEFGSLSAQEQSNIGFMVNFSNNHIATLFASLQLIVI